MTDVISILVTTVVLGSIYGLVAIGMTMIYGILRVLDMSQGSMVMVGGFVGWGIMTSAGLSPVLAVAAAFVATFGLGVVTQLVSVQPLLGRRGVDFEMITFITTFAVAIVLSNVALQIFGAGQRNVPNVVEGSVKIYNGVSLSYQSIVMAAVAIAIMIGFGIFLTRSRYGIAIRAIAQDVDAARLMGVPIRRVFPLVMGFASSLAGIAGVFLAAQYFASPVAGDQPLLIALIVVVFGGLGSLPGTIYAAYVIGLVQATASTLFGTTWSLPILYAVILVVLLVRPHGLLGRPMEARL
ncbi:MAG: branched-chain amino acid transport system permease protein [Solirubrobacteraceae bacterium]|jgi:branched-chain amino acid transport system permease protein|nr:branched-chain amino acid transport system permease protein [Solirubrobacteraceae bacterium]